MSNPGEGVKSLPRSAPRESLKALEGKTAGVEPEGGSSDPDNIQSNSTPQVKPPASGRHSGLIWNMKIAT